MEHNHRSNRNVVAEFLFLDELSDEDRSESMNSLREVINRGANGRFNLQDFRNISSPRQFVSVNHEHINQFDVQILLGTNKNHFCIAYYPQFDGKFRINAFALDFYAIPDANQKAAVEQMYGDEVRKMYEEFPMLRWVPIGCAREIQCSDNGTYCNCSEIFALAHAILLVQGRDPQTFRFRMSNELHGTYYIRSALFKMYTRNELMLFEEAPEEN